MKSRRQARKKNHKKKGGVLSPKNEALLRIAQNRAQHYIDTYGDNTKLISKKDKSVNFGANEKDSVKPSNVKFLPEGTKEANEENNYKVPKSRQEILDKIYIQRENEDREEFMENRANQQLKKTYNKQINPNLTTDTTRNTDSVRHVQNIFKNTRKGGKHKKRLSRKTKRNIKTKKHKRKY